jgi:hypothetical protein
MHQIQAAYESRWAAPIVTAVGLAVLVTGVAVHGETRMRAGLVEAHRTGYRLGKRTRRPQLAVLPLPREDDRAARR